MKEDPITEEYDVYISTQLASYLHIIQMPQTSTELESGHTNLTLKYKKNSRVMELDLPLPTNHPTYSQSRGEELAAQSVGGRIKVFGAQEDTSGGQLDHIKLSGGSQPISPDVKYFAATISNGTATWITGAIKCF